MEETRNPEWVNKLLELKKQADEEKMITKQNKGQIKNIPSIQPKR